MGDNNSNVNFESSLDSSVDCTSSSHLNEIVVEIIQDGTNSIIQNNKRKRAKSSKLNANNSTGYKHERPIAPKVKPQVIDREPSKELLEAWREALQKSRQVCCPHPDCQLSYCSIRGLLLHYRACSGKRNDEEIVKCKICCNYVSGRISLAHHNRLLHSGMPTKAINSFMDSQTESKKSFNLHTTKSRRQVRKPARYRENQDSKDDPNKSDDFIQNLSPMTMNERKSTAPCATVTRLPSGSYKKEDFPEAVLKSSFLYRMGLAPTDLASNVVVLEDEIEDNLSMPLSDDAFKLPTDVCNNIRANYSQLYQRTKTAKVDSSESSVTPDIPPVKRKRGRPRKDKLKIIEPVVNSESQKDEDKSPKRKRRRKNAGKIPEQNEFLSVTACGLCWEEFKDQVSCDKHVATKHGTQGPLDSEKLLMKEQKAKLQKIMRQHGILTCPNQHCKKPLLSITGYLNHIKNCKQDEISMNESCNSTQSEETYLEKVKTCRECNEKFSRDEFFESHALTRHHGLARIVGDDRPFTEDDRIAAQKKMLKQYGQIPCPNCPKHYLSIQGLQYHLRTCKSDTCQEVVCNYCRILFTNLQTFREHVIARHNGLALPVGDERIYNQEEKKKILQQVLRLNQKLICLNDGCPEEFKIIEDYLQHEESCSKAKPVHKIECGICKQKFNTQPQFNNHAMIAHNGLARINGSEQTFTEEEKVQALKKTLQVLKRLHCLREDCGKTFTSLGGYQYHLKNCGQECVAIECKICGKKLKEASMKTHMKMTHPPSPPPQPPKQEIVDCSQKRPAAKRAREKVSEIAKKYFRDEQNNAVAKSDSSESEDSTYELPDSHKSYTKPTQSISSQIYSEWKKQFDVNGKASCTNSGCTEEFTELTELKRHFILCKFSTLALCYVCNICQKRCRRETQMQNHVDRMHSFGEAEESDSDIEGGGSSNHGQSGYGKYNLSSFRNGQDFEPLSQAAEWTYDYCKRNYEFSLFPEWLPDVRNWRALSESESKQYLPEETTSISFQVVDGIKKEKPTSNWTKLNRFSCNSQSDSAQTNPSTLFAGGPVWAMAWCPTPASKVCDQYLALSSHQAMEEKKLVSSAINKSGLIQIWKVGNADDSSSSLESKFVLGIAHSFGDVWKLEWCPSGCWNDENNNNVTLPRLGLLAAACSDGKIYIFSVPIPESLTKPVALPIFQAKPIIALQTRPTLDLHNFNPNNDSQMLTLAWQRHKGHTKIAGGFANGFVAIWNLSAETTYLRKECGLPPNTETQYGPYKIFQAHADCVKDVAWAPFSDGNYLATVGWDRQVHVWSIEDTSLPINSQKLGKLLSVAWSPYWCGVFVTQEECYNLWRTNLRFIDTGYFGNGSRCLTSHNGSIWHVSISDWLNCSATCDSNGEVIGTVMTQLLYGVQNLKNLSKRRFPIYRTNVCNLKTLEPDSNKENAEEKKEKVVEKPLTHLAQEESDSCDSAPTVKPIVTKNPESYKEAATDYGMVFLDNVPTSSKLLPSEEITRLNNASTMTPSDIQSFPIASINKVAWNPNLGSHLLVASGGNSGLIRIHRIHWLQQANVEKIRTKLQVYKDTSDETVYKVLSNSSTSAKSPIAETAVDNSEVNESNCISHVKSSAIDWLKQANIEKIRTGLQQEKAKTENLETSSCSADKSREITIQFPS